MAGSFEGLSVPLHGGYQAYEDDGTTVFLTVDADGQHNFAWTDKGADNFIAVTLADSTAVSSGYVQAFYANVSTTGAWTGGQLNVFAADITLSGTPQEVSGMYLYFCETGTTTTTSMQLNGIVVNLEEMGGNLVNRSGIKIYSNDADCSGDIDAAFSAYCSGASGTFRSLLSCGGNTEPEYFFEYTTAIGSSSRMLCDYTASTSATMALRLLIDGSVYNVPCVADSCS